MDIAALAPPRKGAFRPSFECSNKQVRPGTSVATRCGQCMGCWSLARFRDTQDFKLALATGHQSGAPVDPDDLYAWVLSDVGPTRDYRAFMVTYTVDPAYFATVPGAPREVVPARCPPAQACKPSGAYYHERARARYLKAVGKVSSRVWSLFRASLCQDAVVEGPASIRARYKRRSRVPGRSRGSGGYVALHASDERIPYPEGHAMRVAKARGRTRPVHFIGHAEVTDSGVLHFHVVVALPRGLPASVFYTHPEVGSVRLVSAVRNVNAALSYCVAYPGRPDKAKVGIKLRSRKLPVSDRWKAQRMIDRIFLGEPTT